MQLRISDDVRITLYFGTLELCAEVTLQCRHYFQFARLQKKIIKNHVLILRNILARIRIKRKRKLSKRLNNFFSDFHGVAIINENNMKCKK